MSEVRSVGIKLDDTYCGRCSICRSVCPYEAISVDPEKGEVKIDVEKCQFCGICYSACPVTAIDIIYYNDETLAKHVEKLVKEKNLHTLVLMCRGNSPSTCEVEEILKNENISGTNYIPVRVPCIGRITTEFIMKTLASGVKRIIAIQCEEDFCRYKRGSRINTRRLLLTKKLLRQLGFRDDTLTLMKYAQKAVYFTDKCVGCGKCTFTCPYEAIEAETFATPKINLDKCVGCGACALVCPHLAIQLKGFEYETVSNLIQHYAKAARQLKRSGVKPTVLVFCCQWSEFSALDQPENKLFDNKAVVMEIPCFKGLDPAHVVEALRSGFDGVLAVVCSPEDCKLELGRDVAERNATVLQQTLSKLNLQDRFEVYTASPRCVGDFNKNLTAFINKIGALPPLDITIPSQIVKIGGSRK
jgi:coenzyme F420-reducing hydrogenase delta subunit/ferredoxin-like protein FixX